MYLSSRTNNGELLVISVTSKRIIQSVKISDIIFQFDEYQLQNTAEGQYKPQKEQTQSQNTNLSQLQGNSIQSINFSTPSKLVVHIRSGLILLFCWEMIESSSSHPILQFVPSLSFNPSLSLSNHFQSNKSANYFKLSQNPTSFCLAGLCNVNNCQYLAVPCLCPKKYIGVIESYDNLDEEIINLQNEEVIAVFFQNNNTFKCLIPQPPAIFGYQTSGMCICIDWITRKSDDGQNNGIFLAMGFEDGTLRLFDISSPSNGWVGGTLHCRSNQHVQLQGDRRIHSQNKEDPIQSKSSSVICLCVNPSYSEVSTLNKAQIILATSDGCVMIANIQLKNYEKKEIIEMNILVCAQLIVSASSIAISSDGKLTAAGLVDGSTQIFETQNLRPLGLIRFHTAQISKLSFVAQRDNKKQDESNYETSLITASADSRIALWNIHLIRNNGLKK